VSLAPPPILTISETARQVVLDVVVADAKGRPLKGLKQSDFVLSEDGRPQRLVAFSERDAPLETAASAPEAPLPPDTFEDHPPVVNQAAMTVIVFDTNDIEWQAGYYARYGVAQFLKNTTPGTPLCLFKLDPRGLQLIQDFTTDASVLKKAVESKRNAQWPQLSPWIGMTPRGMAIRQLASYLAAFPGRKNLIWFGGGSPIAQTGGPNGLFPDTDTFLDDLQGAHDVLTLNKVALYTVDPRGVVMGRGETEDVLYEGANLTPIAAATGGKAFYNNNGLKEIVQEVVATGGHYYTVAYTPTDANLDGRFRKIKVGLVGNGQATLASEGLKGPVHLEYRSGYYGTTEPRHRRRISYSAGTGRPGAMPSPIQQAMTFAAVTPFQVQFRARVEPESEKEKIGRHEERPKNNFLNAEWEHKAYREYKIHYSVSARDVQFTPAGTGPGAGSRATVELVAVVYDERGVQANSIVNTMTLELSAKDYARVMQGTLGMDQTVAIPARGEFYLRLGVQDMGSGRIGALEVAAKEIRPVAPPGMAKAP